MLKKQVSEFLATCFGDLQAARSNHDFWRLILATCKPRDPVTSLHKMVSRLSSQLASCKLPKNSFLKSFSWENCFKPLPSSFKLLFQYVYIKTQSIWMVFHSINISKVIINSFHWFWSLDYVLESFVLLVGIFIIEVGKT